MISSLCFAYSKEIVAIIANVIALVIDYSIKESIKWLGI